VGDTLQIASLRTAIGLPLHRGRIAQFYVHSKSGRVLNQVCAGKKLKARRVMHAFTFKGFMALGLALPTIVVLAAPTLAQNRLKSNNFSVAEGWAWSRISERCDDWLDPKDEDNPGWRDESKAAVAHFPRRFLPIS
jgi:hypothetical protein